jgi:lipopolysaccharide/colanic/teichoic acid biosynthesis glycosyltransferase
MMPRENAADRDAVDAGAAGDLRTPEETRHPARRDAPLLRAAGFDEGRTLFALSRRHDLPFGVVVAWLRARPEGPVAGAGAFRARLLALVASATRETDALGDLGDGSVVVFCPATTPEGVEELAQRLRDGAGELPLSVGAASFRSDALLLSELVARARERARDPGAEDGASGGPILLRRRPRRSGASGVTSRVAKRVFDLGVVLAAAPVWLPLCAAVAVAVKLSDRRAPVFFAQERTGRGGRRFRMYKFRTMVPDAEARKAELAARSERSWPDFKIADDPRITSLGRTLRATSLDELPQCWNVLRGDMSLVGPRPTSFSSETYEAWQTARLEVVPGLTGLWQVEARDCADFAERIRLDLRYVEEHGFLYDLKLLLRTIPAVLWNREGR